MQQATPAQKKAINAILAKQGLMDTKADMISNATGGRTTHSSELLFDEAQALLSALNTPGSMPTSARAKPSKRMMGKLFGMAHEIGWVKKVQAVGKNGLEMKKDYTRLHSWVEKYGYLHKPLNQYTYKEIPKLVTQFELGVYKTFLRKL